MAAYRTSVPVRVLVKNSTGTKETFVKATKSTTVGFIIRSVAFWLPEQGKGCSLVLPDGQKLQDMGTRLGVYKLQPYDVIQVKRFFPGIISVQVGSTQQNFQVSMDSTVWEITQQICKETGISDVESYSLVLMEGGSGVSEVGSRGPAQGKWLSSDMTLDQIGVENMSKLQLRKLPQSRREGKSELILDQVTSVTIGSNSESRLVEKKRLPAIPSNIPKRGSTPSPTALQTIQEDHESNPESQGVVSSDTGNVDDISFDELEALLAESYREISQLEAEQPEISSAAEKSSLHGQSSGTHRNGDCETLNWDIGDSGMQSGCGEVETCADEFQMNRAEMQPNGHHDSPLDSNGCLAGDAGIPKGCFTDETVQPIVKPQSTSTPLKVEQGYSSREEGETSEALESPPEVEAKEDSTVASHREEPEDAEYSFPKALHGVVLSPQETLQSLYPVSPPDLEESHLSPTHQPPSSFTTELENQLNAMATVQAVTPKHSAVAEDERHRYYHTYSPGMNRGSCVQETPGQTFEVELHSYPGATLQRYLVPLKDTWPRRQKDVMEAAGNDSGIGCSPFVVHSSRKNSDSMDLIEGDSSSTSASHPSDYKGPMEGFGDFTPHDSRRPAPAASVASTDDSVDGAPVYPEGQRKVPISRLSNGKQTEVVLSQGDDEVFGGPSPIQPGKDFPFSIHLSDVKSPEWSRLGASSCSQTDYLSTDTLLTERDFHSREFVLEDSEEVSLVDRGGKYLQRQGHSASTLEQHRMVTSVKALQRSISSPEVRIGSGEDDHPSITSADSTTWRLDYYKMDYPDVASKYTVLYVIVMDQDIRPFLVNPKKNVRDIIREICCTFRMDNPSQWQFCMPRGLQVILSKAASASRQTMLSVGSMGGGITKKTFFHLSTDIISREDILDGGRPLIDQFPFAGKPYVIHMRKREGKFSGSLDALLEECDIGCEWPDGEVDAKTRCFHQTWCSIAQSHCPVEKHIAAEIAALLLQAHFGNYSKSNRRYSEVLPLFLPEMYRTKRSVLKQTRKIYKRLKGITAKHAMQSVITRFREQPGHDGIFFNVKAIHEKSSKLKASKLKPGIFGMCCREVIYLDPKTAKVIFRRGYNEIKSVEASKRHFKIDFGAHVADPFAASSPVALEVMNILKLFIQMHPIPAELQPRYQACSVSQTSLPLQNNPQVEIIQI